MDKNIFINEILDHLSMTFGKVDLSDRIQMKEGKAYAIKLMEAASIHKSGSVWKTKSGRWAGKKGDRAEYFDDKEKANTYVHGKAKHSQEKPSTEKPQVATKAISPKAISPKVLQSLETNVKAYAKILNTIAYANESDKKIGHEFLGQISKGNFAYVKQHADTINKYFRYNPTDSTKIYVATKTPGDFSQNHRAKLKVPAQVHAELKNSGLKPAVGVTTSTGADSTVGGTALSAQNFISNKTPVKLNIKTTDTSITVGDHNISHITAPSIKQLVESLINEIFTKSGDPNPHAKAQSALRAISKHNASIETLKTILADDKFNKFIDPLPGTTPHTDEGRKKIVHSVLNDLSKKFVELMPNEVGKDFSEKIAKLSSSENFEKDIRSLMLELLQNTETAKSAPRLAEVMTYTRRLLSGQIVYLPASDNFPLADMFSMSGTQLPNNPSPEQIATAIDNIYVSVDLRSVKKDSGGAATVGPKIDMSVFKNKDTRKNLLILKNTYNLLWKDNNLDETTKVLKDLSDKYDISTEAILTDNLKKQVDNIFDRFKDRHKDPVLYKKQLTMYMIAGKMMEQIYNKDIDLQLFSNERWKEKKNSIDLEITDGIEKVSKIRFKYNLFNDKGKPNNIFATEFHSEDVTL